jgi:phenylpyruvate tautomerase PptA (4-oxalocrotonate tautomerase family)
MPYLRIQTNVEREPGDSQPALLRVSSLLAEMLGKPEKYVMAALEAGQPMVFGGSEAPAAYLELKSIGLPQARTEELSRALCEFVSEEFGVRKERIYIEFTDAQGAMWGWNGGTF